MAHHAKNDDKRNFYPRSPCGERPFLDFLCRIAHGFLSTLSLRRATARGWSSSRFSDISIHALLAESDRNIRLWRFPA